MGNNWNIINILDSDAGLWFYFKIYAIYLPAFINQHDVYYGQSNQLSNNVIKSNMDIFCLSLLIMSFGLVMFILFLMKNNERKAFFGLSIFMIFMSLRNIAESDVQLIFFNHPLFWAYIAWCSSLVLFIGFFIYINDIFIKKYKLFFNLLLIFQCVYTITVLVMDIFNILPIFKTEQIYFIYIFIIILICSSVILYKALKGNMEAVIVLIGSLPIAVTETYDILGRAFNLLPWKKNMVFWGLFIFVISQCLILLLRFLKVYRDKETLADELAYRNKNLENIVSSRTSELTGALNNLKHRNLIMESDLDMARKIQMRILPDESPVRNIAMFYKPIERVGGDFYDFVSFEGSEKIGIFISDVSGHGVPAAFITSLIKGSLHQSNLDENDPAAFLVFLNDFLITQTNGNFVTAFSAFIIPLKEILFIPMQGTICRL